MHPAWCSHNKLRISCEVTLMAYLREGSGCGHEWFTCWVRQQAIRFGFRHINGHSKVCGKVSFQVIKTLLHKEDIRYILGSKRV